MIAHEKISSSEYAIDGNLSRFVWMPHTTYVDFDEMNLLVGSG